MGTGANLFQIAAGVTSAVGSLSLIAALFYYYASRQKTQSIYEQIRGLDVTDPKAIVEILTTFSDDNSRLSALRAIVKGDAEKTNQVLGLIQGGVDASAIIVHRYKYNIRMLVAAGVFLLALAVLVYIIGRVRSEYGQSLAARIDFTDDENDNIKPSQDTKSFTSLGQEVQSLPALNPSPTVSAKTPSAIGKDLVARLSARAQIALAARCARRVEPIFRVAVGRRLPKDLDVVIAAIEAAEKTAAGTHDETVAERHARARELNKQIVEVLGPLNPARKALSSAAYASRAAKEFLDKKYDDAAKSAAEAIDSALLASRNLALAVDAIKRDAVRIQELIGVSGEAYLLPPEKFGPIWADGQQPQGWPDCVVQYDLYISYANEDLSIVSSIAKELIAKGFCIWYDEISIQPGDSIRKKIDHGIARSRYGLIVLSEPFFKSSKKWLELEHDGLTAAEMYASVKIIPLWYGVTENGVVRFSPTLASRAAIRHSDISNTVEQISKILSGKLRHSSD